MNNVKTFFVFLFVFLFFLTSNVVNAQTSTESEIDSIDISLTGNALNTTSALNVTVLVNSGTAQLEKPITFMGTGATLILTEVDAASNLVTVVWSGTITDGKATIKVKVKKGSVTGAPVFSVSSVKAAGDVDISTQVNSTVTTTTAVPLGSATPSAFPTETPSPTLSGEDELAGLELSGPDSIVLKRRSLNLIKLIVKGLNLDGRTRCKVSSSDTDILRVRPSRFTLTPSRSRKIIFARVPFLQVLDFLEDDLTETVIVNVSCNNDTEVEKEITVNP